MRRLKHGGERPIRRGRAHGYNARRGKVGDCRHELPPETAVVVDALIDRDLDPLFDIAPSASGMGAP